MLYIIPSNLLWIILLHCTNMLWSFFSLSWSFSLMGTRYVYNDRQYYVGFYISLLSYWYLHYYFCKNKSILENWLDTHFYLCLDPRWNFNLISILWLAKAHTRKCPLAYHMLIPDTWCWHYYILRVCSLVWKTLKKSFNSLTQVFH